jgi:hypothetical protein
MLILHDKNNQQEAVLLNASEISSVEPYVGGSIVRMKNGSYHAVMEDTLKINSLLNQGD